MPTGPALRIGTDFLKRVQAAAMQYGIALPDREPACVPIESPVGQRAGLSLRTREQRRMHPFPGLD
jgi:RNA-splicing ligase RtcB